MSTLEPILHITGLTKNFGGIFALNDIDLTLDEGEILGVIGPNGAGKSTMFNLISGSMQASSGNIQFLGKLTANLKPHQLADMGLMRTFQHNQPFESMSLIENIMVGASARFRKNLLTPLFQSKSQKERDVREEAGRLLKFVGLEEFIHEEVSNLSFGQGRMLEVARALAGEPRVLLLDEPAAGLTLGECENLAKIITQVSENKVAVILIEHDMHFLMKLVDRVIVLNFGEKIADKNPTEVMQDPVVQSAYLGEAGGMGIA